MPQRLGRDLHLFRSSSVMALSAAFQSTAIRARVGTASWSSSSRFPLKSGREVGQPRQVPPGPRQAGDEPVRTGSSAAAMTMGIVGSLAWPHGPRSSGASRGRRRATALARRRGPGAARAARGIAEFNGEVLPLLIAELAQPLPEGLHQGRAHDLRRYPIASRAARRGGGGAARTTSMIPRQSHGTIRVATATDHRLWMTTRQARMSLLLCPQGTRAPRCALRGLKDLPALHHLSSSTPMSLFFQEKHEENFRISSGFLQDFFRDRTTGERRHPAEDGIDVAPHPIVSPNWVG